MNADSAIGWASTVVLLATLLTQMHNEWRAGTARHVSAWLFVGQCIASVGFLVYSVRVGSPVFIASNALILAVAIAGQVLTAYLKKHPRTKER